MIASEGLIVAVVSRVFLKRWLGL